jgi:hypothetical protein
MRKNIGPQNSYEGQYNVENLFLGFPSTYPISKTYPVCTLGLLGLHEIILGTTQHLWNESLGLVTSNIGLLTPKIP